MTPSRVTAASDITRERQRPSGPGHTSVAGNPRPAALPAVLDLPHAAHLLGIGRTLAYELVRTNQWPTPVIRLGRLIKIPSAPLIELLSTGGPTHSAQG